MDSKGNSHFEQPNEEKEAAKTEPDVSQLLEEIKETLIKGMNDRKEIKRKKELVLEQIENGKQSQNATINDNYQRKMEEIGNKDQCLDEALQSSNKEDIAQLLHSFLQK